MEKNQRIARALREEYLSSIPLGDVDDIRKNPSIKLRTILTTVFLMPFLGAKSLLALDREARTGRLKRLMNCRRKLVVSDTTVRRVLGWLNPAQIRALLLALTPKFQSQNLLRRRLAPGAPARSLGILDGSYMGGHWLSALCLVGKINYPALIWPLGNRGAELAMARPAIKEAKTRLGSAFPELWLLDALYFTQNVFQQITSEGSHLLIKLKDADYRTVTRDAANLFQHFGGDEFQHGFDNQRLCSWSSMQTIASFAGIPVQVLYLNELYHKRTNNKKACCWCVTTDLSLSAAEIREAAHLRWQIENNLFKRLSHLAGTKHFYFKDPRAFFNMLHLFSAAVACLDALTTIINSHRRVFKALMAGRKFTQMNFLSTLAEVFEGTVLIE